MWLPAKDVLLAVNDGSPPSEGTGTHSIGRHRDTEYGSHRAETQDVSRANMNFGRSFTSPHSASLYAKCIHKPDIQKEQRAATSSTRLPSSPSSQLTSLADEVAGRLDWKHTELDVVGFRISLAQPLEGQQQATQEKCMRLTVWPLSTTAKGDFIWQG